MQLGKLIFEIKAAHNGWDIFTIIKIKIISLIKIKQFFFQTEKLMLKYKKKSSFTELQNNPYCHQYKPSFERRLKSCNWNP